MAKDEKTKVPVATGITLSTDPTATHSGLFFKTEAEPGFIAVSLANKELSRLVTLLLTQAQEIAAKDPSTSTAASMQTMPLRPSHVGVAPGKDRKEAILGFRVGNLELSVAVDTGTLHRICTDFLANTTTGQPRRSQ